MVVVFQYGPFKVERHSGFKRGEVLYTVTGPKGEVIRGNRSSVVDAAVEMDKYNLLGGYRKWETLEGLLGSKTFYHGWDIDPEIRGLVAALNDAGYRTLGSCAGHMGEEGFVTIDKKLTSGDKTRIRSIFKGLDLRVTGFGGKPGFNSVHFVGVGEQLGEYPFWLK